MTQKSKCIANMSVDFLFNKSRKQSAGLISYDYIYYDEADHCLCHGKADR